MNWSRNSIYLNIHRLPDNLRVLQGVSNGGSVMWLPTLHEIPLMETFEEPPLHPLTSIGFDPPRAEQVVMSRIGVSRIKCAVKLDRLSNHCFFSFQLIPTSKDKSHLASSSHIYLQCTRKYSNGTTIRRITKKLHQTLLSYDFASPIKLVFENSVSRWVSFLMLWAWQLLVTHAACWG